MYRPDFKRISTVDEISHGVGMGHFSTFALCYNVLQYGIQSLAVLKCIVGAYDIGSDPLYPVGSVGKCDAATVSKLELRFGNLDPIGTDLFLVVVGDYVRLSQLWVKIQPQCRRFHQGRKYRYRVRLLQFRVLTKQRECLACILLCVLFQVHRQGKCDLLLEPLHYHCKFFSVERLPFRRLCIRYCQCLSCVFVRYSH